jgi:hypothetical protein
MFYDMDSKPPLHERITWAPKVPQAKIWQLYHNDALGAVDEDLVEDVGYRLLQRCRSIRLATNRGLECPRCGSDFMIPESEPWRLLPGPHICPNPGCGWVTTAEEWHVSWRHRDLLGAAAVQPVDTFLGDYPRAASAQDRMLCIDQLIHAFHISLRDGQAGRSFANNLIEGSHKQVVELLDRLFTLPGGVNKDQWKIETEKMWLRRRGMAEGPSINDEIK